MGSEKFCLRWNDFESQLSGSFKEIRESKDFFDVTLVSDERQVEAHKVIISACSPFFRDILRRNPHQHPLLYLKGVKHRELESVLDFIYHGEVNVAQNDLNSFLAVAEELQIKGLTQRESQTGSADKKSYQQPKIQSQSRDPMKSSKPAIPVSSVSQQDDDIAEIVPIKTELSSSKSDYYQDSVSAADANHPVAQYEEEGYDSYQDYETDQSYDVAPSGTGQDFDNNKGNNYFPYFEYWREAGNVLRSS